ncbi:DUF692 domain-containing protein [Chromobacterium sp. IIBBL 290-4]|uniref:DUF692 domain-containing protein n=1 Tax=Chromobacterium sp. IIBBL 290-4 TaxID=2953890 RepID=UPI0020B8EBED|nr:DUF692 domain-containing protein [Chromobacterium sp. IIBBL 290-4]UTH73514.1 DUF692 domain-containing protein [Chromobacterium sp. IIBBL 290-4]
MRTIAPLAVGVGLRAEHAQWLADNDPQPGIDFLEITLENWLGVGGRKREQLERIAEKYPLIAHGLSLSIGDELPLDREHVAQARRFLDRYGIDLYSDHLSYSRDSQGYLYELLPLPRSEAEAKRIAAKIRQAQDMLARPLILENISYYHQHPGQMDEADFIRAVAERSGCQLLLDINNVRVNAGNHGYQAERFIAALPSAAIRYFHIAGHWRREDGMLIDTHGEPVCAKVEALARHAVAVHGPRPLVLERDNRLPPWQDLCGEAVALGRRLHPAQAWAG